MLLNRKTRIIFFTLAKSKQISKIFRNSSQGDLFRENLVGGTFFRENLERKTIFRESLGENFLTWSAFFQAAVHLFYKRSPIRVHIFQIELHIFEKSCIREFSTMRWWGWQIKGATLFATPFRGMLWNLSLKLGGVIRNVSLELGDHDATKFFTRETRNEKRLEVA